MWQDLLKLWTSTQKYSAVLFGEGSESRCRSNGRPGLVRSVDFLNRSAGKRNFVFMWSLPSKTSQWIDARLQYTVWVENWSKLKSESIIDVGVAYNSVNPKTHTHPCIFGQKLKRSPLPYYNFVPWVLNLHVVSLVRSVATISEIGIAKDFGWKPLVWFLSGTLESLSSFFTNIWIL